MGRFQAKKDPSKDGFKVPAAASASKTPCFVGFEEQENLKRDKLTENMRCASSMGRFQAKKDPSKDDFKVPAAASARAAATCLPSEVQDVQYLPDIAPYPRYGPCKPTVPESQTLLGQAEQSWTCKLCKVLIKVPAGPKAREKLRVKIDSHKQSRHPGARSQFDRLGATTQIVTPSESLPATQAAWTCHLCQK